MNMRRKRVSRDITPLLRSLVSFQDDDGGARTQAAVLVDEGDMAWLEGDATEVGLETIFLEMSPTVAQLADANEGARLDAMSLAHTPGALVAEPLVGPIPGAIDGLLDPSDVAAVQ